MLIPRRFVQPHLQRGVAGDQYGRITGYLSPAEIGAPFNGGVINAGATVDVDLILVSGYNDFMLIESHAGNAVTWRTETVDADAPATIYFDDLIGAGAIGTNRLTWGAPAGVTSNQPPVWLKLRCVNGAGVNATGMTLRLWFGVR